MSHVPKVDEAKEIFSLVDSDDSKGKPNPKKDEKSKKEYKNDDYNDYDIHEDDDVTDDKEW